ncbi:MAG TPA: class II aldolase/adducin family protein [Candidatus Binatia bacterium]|nr:class II aldolase/adducin family protein [Candidatus Binatia bacterium]
MTAGEATLRDDIARFCRVTWDRGLVSAAGGNLSARLADGDRFLITPSGLALRDTTPDDLVTIDLEGRKVAGPERWKPSKESLMHTAIYKARREARAVAHLHPPHAIAFGIRNEPIPLMTVTSEERLHLTPVVAPATSGSRELADGVAATVATAPADTQVLLLARHGIIAWGGSVQQACDVADLAEYTAKIAIAHAALPGRRRVIDISVPNAPGMHVYPGDPVPRIEPVRQIARGDVCNLSHLAMGSHTGTHVDAPYHFLADGPRLGDVPFDRMIGEALVADLRGRAAVDAAALDDVPLRAGDILLCRTDNSERWASPEFRRDFTYLTEDAAALLVARGVRAVGMDYLSIERFGSENFPVHHRLLGAGVFVIEGLDLRAVEPGRYLLVCLPLKFPDLDGAPARAVLLA